MTLNWMDGKDRIEKKDKEEEEGGEKGRIEAAGKDVE